MSSLKVHKYCRSETLLLVMAILITLAVNFINENTHTQMLRYWYHINLVREVKWWKFLNNSANCASIVKSFLCIFKQFNAYDDMYIWVCRPKPFTTSAHFVWKSKPGPVFVENYDLKCRTLEINIFHKNHSNVHNYICGSLVLI